ncbi:MAG: tetratricopeptide repeat protein, partial [Flavobacteriales bacterium]|nr:tetratricopeptide repeat protein [Flavobacteriales bacterium]
MKLKPTRLFFFFLTALLINSKLLSQERVKDSLITIWKDQSKSDSLRLRAFSRLIWTQFLFTDPDSAFKLAAIQQDFATKVNDTYFIADAFNNKGACKFIQGKHVEAITYYKECLRLSEQFNDKLMIANTLNNISGILVEQGRYSAALYYTKKTLQSFRELGDKKGELRAIANIGAVYFSLADSVVTFGDKELAYQIYDTAQSYLLKCISLSDGNTLLHSVGHANTNLGAIALFKGNYDSAYVYLYRSIKSKLIIADNEGLTECYKFLGDYFLKTRRLDSALFYSRKAFDLSQKLKLRKNASYAAYNLYQIYKEKGNLKDAIEYLNFHYKTKDSLNSISTKKYIIEQQLHYEFEKKEAIQNEKHLAEITKNKALAKSKQFKQNLVIGGVSVILVLVIIFMYLLYGRFKTIREQKNIIESQKIYVEEKNHEILDSINYAKRIQSAILPSNKTFKELLSNAFVIYKPKDIVAGDFYWLEKKNELVLFAAADCTGHGVPGAMVSVVCNNALNRSV